jgi:hypothetical protein
LRAAGQEPTQHARGVIRPFKVMLVSTGNAHVTQAPKAPLFVPLYDETKFLAFLHRCGGAVR